MIKPHVFFRVKAAISRLLHDRDGNVAIFVGLAAVPMLFFVGAAVDYGRAINSKDSIAAAADSGALEAAIVAQAEFNSGTTNWNADGVAAGQRVFLAGANGLPGTAVNGPTVTISRLGGTVTATLSYSATYTTALLNRTIALKGTVSSTTQGSGTTIPAYTDVHFVIDNSTSMGIGATLTDQNTLQSAIGCTIACHYTDNYGDVNNLAAARASGATLRIDVVKSAVASALTQLQKLSTGTNIRVALYTMSNGLTTVYPLSSNISGAQTALTGIDLANAQYEGGTNTTNSLHQLNSLLATAGTGSTSAAPAGVVMVMTDAVQDDTYEYLPTASQASANGWSTSNMSVKGDPNWVPFAPYQDFPIYAGDPIEQGFDPSPCTPIKAKGYSMMTLEVQYLIPSVGVNTNDIARFAFISGTLQPQIAANMAACASNSGYSYSASTPASIAAAVASMTAAAGGVAGVPHLTQ